MASKVNSFVAANVAKAEKTNKQVLQERAEDFVEVATSEINVQAANAQAELVRAKSLVKTTERSLASAEKALENAKMDLPTNSDFASWLSSVESAKRAVYNAEMAVKNAKSNVTVVEEQIASWEAYAAIFA